MTTLCYRTVWISDTHLGTKGCKAEYLLDFLEQVSCETLYLVGDIIDFWSWQERTGFYWSSLHSDIVQRIIDKAKQGTKVIYIPGNHDEIMRKHPGLSFNGIEIQLEAIHQLADGRRFLVIHGDLFDHLVCENKLLAAIGGELYEILIKLNHWIDFIRKHMGYHQYWSLSAYIKDKVKNISRFMDNFQHILALQAEKQNVDGIICGHIHFADIKEMEFGKTYCNTGDWVENCTALTETANGELSLIHWIKYCEQQRKQQQSETTSPTPASLAV